MMARKLLAFAILIWGLPALLQAATPRDPYQFFFEQSLGDLTEELEIAREEGKQGVFLFESDPGIVRLGAFCKNTAEFCAAARKLTALLQLDHLVSADEGVGHDDHTIVPGANSGGTQANLHHVAGEKHPDGLDV